jgi:hypothetical protein
MSILNLFLAEIGLALLGLLLLSWRMFPDDRGVHQIYRDSRLNDTQEDRGISTLTEPVKRYLFAFAASDGGLFRETSTRLRDVENSYS